MGIIVFALAVLAWGCIALSARGREVLATPPGKAGRWILRGAGWAVLAVVLVLCISEWGAAVGLVAWVGTLIVAAWPVSLLLALRMSRTGGL